jgi:hypothetical protein
VDCKPELQRAKSTFSDCSLGCLWRRLQLDSAATTGRW